MNVSELFASAKPGKLVTYAISSRGFMKSNDHGPSVNAEHWRKTLWHARCLQGHGKVTLFQKRFENGVTAYYFVKLSDRSRRFLEGYAAK